MTALMTADGVPPVARAMFGEPKPGLIDFTNLITAFPGAGIATAPARTTI